MTFIKDTLKINPEKTSIVIEKFILETLHNLYGKKGAIIGLSGGLDSAVSAALAVRALGPKRVTGILLPEKNSSPKSREYGQNLADSLNIECFEVNLSGVIEKFGVYKKQNAIVEKIFPDIKKPYKFRLVLPQDLLDRKRLNVYSIEVLLEDGTTRKERLAHNDYLEFMAANDIKQRARMVQLYYEAEKRHYIVCGTTNKSEMMQGFFVKYGDGGVDIEPLAHLYKVQVFELGEYLGIPREILSRDPSPDTYSYEVSDKDFFFCLSYDVVDTILYAIEHKISNEEIATELNLLPEQVERARADLVRRQNSARHSRIMPPIIEE